MNMKKLMMSLLLLTMWLPSAVAQDDDMYFVPTKENEAKEAESYGLPYNTYYAGSSRSVDEYNRQLRSSVTPIDSMGNDIIDFSAVRGVYPDSTYQETSANDYKYTRRLSRFDDYTPSEAYWEGYRDGRWSSPWYYSSWYGWYDYDPWYWDNYWYYGGYYTWYSPWHYGYYRPWRYGWYGYRGPYWYGGRSVRYYVSRPIRRTTYSANRSFGGRTTTGRTYGSTRTFGQPSSSSFGGSRGSSSFGGRSFGGGGGGSASGGRSFGGGGGGGGRSASGGRSFGGRR